ncbi:hypothetical protein MAPG_06215 [Magnaporthiopsis poae ATCC 64411]|uniref:Uncharacterized protein n=1 Tax=Magnaporthiopsis poae (strain ATCC 64411 / 73-15) TaxID=644358 RepID=A0A0C4E1F5_MAGP6|nr:hypothetical protein MAPG_06215 [Magnaporthiopsis poae ATCC 64411]
MQTICCPFLNAQDSRSLKFSSSLPNAQAGSSKNKRKKPSHPITDRPALATHPLLVRGDLQRGAVAFFLVAFLVGKAQRDPRPGLMAGPKNIGPKQIHWSALGDRPGKAQVRERGAALLPGLSLPHAFC